jgi:hypothetical protein
MIPGHIDGAHATLRAPENWDEAQDGVCTGLPVYVEQLPSGIIQISSVWFPTPEEIASIVAGAPVKLTIVGSSHPPVMLSVGELPSELARQCVCRANPCSHQGD